MLFIRTLQSRNVVNIGESTQLMSNKFNYLYDGERIIFNIRTVTRRTQK